MTLTYRDAGVDQTGKDAAVDRILSMMRRTHDRGVVDLPWGFAGLYALGGSTRMPRGMKDPVLVACNDGVGTKVKLAQELGRHSTVGIDCVAMCVNDLVVTGGTPLFFLDYIGCGKSDRKLILDLARGVVEGCRRADCALLGGETAEMPGVYPPGGYDLAGFSVGIVDRARVIDGSAVRPGDDVVGVASSGLHSNGYSLARRIVKGMNLRRRFGRTTLGAALLEPTRIYVRSVRTVLKKHRSGVRALANITGGGVPENLPRVLPRGCAAEIRLGSWTVPPLFGFLRERGGVAEAEMHRVFNMGVGMVIITAPKATPAVLGTLERSGEKARVIGRIVRGRPAVRYVGA